RITAQPARSTLFPYTTLFRSKHIFQPDNQRTSACCRAGFYHSPREIVMLIQNHQVDLETPTGTMRVYVYRPASNGSADEKKYPADRKSTRLNSSHVKTSYAVF